MLFRSWQTDLGVGFQNLNSVGQYSGTTNDTLTVANVTLSNNNQPFRCIVTSGSCTDTSATAVLNVINNVGITEFSSNQLLSVYPNPAKDQITIASDASLIGKTYFISDNVGKVIANGKIVSEKTTISIDRFPAGLYKITIDNQNHQSFRIIKE